MELKNMPMTYWILAVLLLVFIMQLVSEYVIEPAVLIQFSNGVYSVDFMSWNFALWPDRVLAGDAVWGIFTSIFLHGGFFHFFFNGYALYMFGLFLERRIGGKNILKIFLAAGLIGSLVHVALAALFGTGGLYALGASGGIFGILGALMVLSPDIRIITFPIPIPMKLWQGILMFTIFAMLFIPSIAHDVHIAGLVVGLMLGKYFRGKEKAEKDFTWNVVYKPKDDYGWIDQYR
jgi:uncharacterized protein